VGADLAQQLVAVAGLGDDVEASLGEHARDAGAQQHRVVGHDHAQRSPGSALARGFLVRALERRDRLARERPGGARALAALLRQRARQHLAERPRQLGAQVEQPRRRVLHVRPHLLDVALALEDHRAGQRAEQHAAERVDVGARVDLDALRLLRRHVVGRAHREARSRQGFLGGGDRLRQPEVGQERVLAPVVARHEDVRRLDVAVDQPVPVGLVERAGDLADDRDGARRLERRLGLEDLAQVGALDVVHGHVQQPVLLAGVEDLDGVRVVDGGGEPALALEARPELVVLGHRRLDQLERDAAPERQVRGAIHHGHAAAARHRVDAMAGKRRSDVQL
jgi:hypothetical protein